MEKIPDTYEGEVFQVSELNNWGMLGMFLPAESNGEFYTVFITDNQSCLVRICQHENMEQAKMMADDMNQYSSGM